MALPEAKVGTPGKTYNPLPADTQYKDTSRPLDLAASAPVMLVNDIRIGTDKIGHFFQLGYSHYYKKTVGAGGLSRDEAIKQGDKSEAGVFGLGFAGVYSCADIAANQAGLAFYEGLAKSPTMAFDIRNHISISLNEQITHNLILRIAAQPLARQHSREVGRHVRVDRRHDRRNSGDQRGLQDHRCAIVRRPEE